MSSYYTLGIKRVSANYANLRALQKVLNKVKLRHVRYSNAVAAAILLSECKAVKSASITRVVEVPMGIWRKGKKT